MITGDTYGVLNRLILNEKIDPSPEGILRILGFVHLYTASGLHIIALESFLHRFFGKTLLSRRVLMFCFWIFLFVLWKLQGFRPGFARILFIFFLKAWARESGFIWVSGFPLLLAFCFDFAIGIEAGWQHYYLAILGGMIGMEAAKRQNRGELAKHLYLSVGSWLLTAPLDLIEHQTISWMTPVWSMLTIPIISTVLYPISVSSYLICGDIPSWLMGCWNHGLELLFHLVDWGFTFSVVEFRTLWVSFGMSLIAYLICRRPIHLVLVVLVFFCFRFHPRFQDYRTHLTQLNVGQGDALLIKKRNRIEMMDVGPSVRSMPHSMIHHLTENGVTHLDAILLSHLDDDHAGGLKWMLPWIPIDSVETHSQFDRSDLVQKWVTEHSSAKWCVNRSREWSGSNPKGQFDNQLVSHIDGDRCFQSGVVDWISEIGLKGKKRKRAKKNGKRKIAQNVERKISGNSLMGIALIPIDDETLYLNLGDSSSLQEAEVWTRHQDFIDRYRFHVLKLSHHGSHTSSDEDFINNIRPNLVVISVGRRNRYHHPHFSVVQRLRRDRVRIHRTDRDGDFTYGGS